MVALRSKTAALMNNKHRGSSCSRDDDDVGGGGDDGVCFSSPIGKCQGLKPGNFCMQNRCSTTELMPFHGTRI